MTEMDPLTRFDRAVHATATIIDGIKPEQLDEPTACTEWNVRQVLNHLVGGTLAFLAMMTGQGPLDRSRDYLGDDPRAAFRDATSRLRVAFAAEGALDRVVPTPFGARPARVLAGMRVNEMLIHGWDLASATGQSTDYEPELAEQGVAEFRSMRASGRGAGMFADERPAPAGASAADRLAAAAGREVTRPART